jgi:hypothetical protein
MNQFGSFYGTALALFGAIVATVFVIGSVSTAGVLG